MKNLYATLLIGAALVSATGGHAQSNGNSKQNGHMGSPRLRAAVGSVHSPVSDPQRGGGPVNDNCSSVTPEALAIGGSVTFTGDNTGATMDGDYEAGSQLETVGLASVWHAFTTTECANVTISYCGTDPVFLDFWIILTTDCPASDALVFNTSFNATDCVDGNGTVYFNDLPAGTYYVPVMNDPTPESIAVGPYTVQVSAAACATPPPPPANDDCAGAIALPVSDWCNFQYFSGLGGTETVPAITCNAFTGSADDDVWFSFVATASDLTIAVQGNDDGDGDVNTGYDAVIELFSGACGTGTSEGCADATLGNELEQIDATGLTVGSTYWVRVYDWYDAPWPDHAFGICVSTNSQINIGMEEHATSAFSLYPNPGTGVFNLQYSGKNGLANIEVFDVTGRVVYNKQAQVANGSTSNMDLTGLSSGNYNVRLTVGDVRTEQRLMVK